MTTILQQPQVTTIDLENGWKFNYLTPFIGTITRGKIRQCSYFGFMSKKDAEIFALNLATSYGHEAVVRRATRLNKAIYEVKAWGVSTEMLINLARQYPGKLPYTINKG